MLIVEYIWDHITQYMMTICMGNTYTPLNLCKFREGNTLQKLIIHKNHLKRILLCDLVYDMHYF